MYALLNYCIPVDEFKRMMGNGRESEGEEWGRESNRGEDGSELEEWV